jgi:thiamine biosynthesis lipoprotein
MAAERTFGVMGTTAHVVVVGHHALLGLAERRLREREDRWSRFLPTSELSRLNAARGRPVVVSPDTFEAIRLAVEAWHWTEGRFDPSVHDSLVAAGYDRDFRAVRDDTRPVLPRPTPGCARVELGTLVPTVRLPVGTALDLGGIGKGLAADLVVEELLEAGAAGACVNVGGDLRVAGEPPTDDGWLVEVESNGTLVRLVDGGLATTTSAKRRWRRGTEQWHHVLDPATGRSAPSTLASVTVAAAEAWRAEVLAKVAFLGGAVYDGTIVEATAA